MQRQIVGMEIHALIDRERHFLLAVCQHQAAMGVDVLDKTGDSVNVDGIRQVARQAHNNRDVGMVAFTGQGKGAVDIDDDFGHLGEQPALNKIVRELFARFHRSNGVGAGRANADFKNIEYADHDASSAVGERRRQAARGY